MARVEPYDEGPKERRVGTYKVSTYYKRARTGISQMLSMPIEMPTKKTEEEKKLSMVIG